MSVKSFKFISPGIFINEIDDSQLPAIPDEVGPVVVGRTERGPGMRPVKVNSFSEYVEIFGNPIPGGKGGDVWRDGNYTAPTYAAYAAQAYLRNSNALTVVRLLGGQSSQVADGGAGEAGYQTSGSNSADKANNGGAYGLFMFPSASWATPVTGVLAAVWYLNEGTIELSGTVRNSTTIATGSAVLMKDLNAAGVTGAGTKEYKVLIKSANADPAAQTVLHETSFNFDRSSSKYIRKVFNTNPTLINSDITRTAQAEVYWLGPTYEREVADNITTGETFGIILGLDSGSTSAANFRFGFRAAQTPWFISQHLQSAFSGFDANNMTKLFKFHTLDSGDDQQKRVKISISEIKASTNEIDPYGSFNVEVRDVKDSDNSPIILERFTSVNLNPNHPKYIGRVIGDQFIVWDDTQRRYRTYGNYQNNSAIIRVEVNEDVEAAATDARLLPFGSFGPVRFKNWGTVLSGSDTPPDTYVTGAAGISHPFRHGNDNPFWFVQAGSSVDGHFTGTVNYPAIPLRVSASDGDIPDPTDAYFGVDASQNGNNRFESSYIDIVRALPNSADAFAVGAGTERAYIFTLDDLKSSNGGDTGEIAVYSSGSRAAGTSFTATSGTYEQVLDMGYDRFTVPLVGGFDGLDVREKEPFNNTDLAGGSDTTNYAYYSVRRALDTIADPESCEMNLLTVPGIYNSALTAKVLEICEKRGDALGLIDIDSGYVPQTENTSDQQTNAGTVATAVSNLRARQLNSSYGACYYPWVQIQDTISDSLVFVPPSVVALGTFSSAQRDSELWFAPAGFTRGGLTEGSAGIPVIQTRARLNSRERDDLYEANINPIATFPAEGIVIFGQKTLQVTPSALDRINVRRLMIFVKKEISRIAATILFDQNVPATWNRFLSKVDPFLRSVQSRLGLTDYRVILDESTTTPELVDRNVMYAKIFLKPARAIEYIALDFVITNTGAGFED
tara:strand:- start:410 stop:3280 length:2871 start_codon:yes stop_codon:yes gene_type:complete